PFILAGSSFIFFSSRRRHTRSYGDWSSDVCSSDLPGIRDIRQAMRDGFSTSGSLGLGLPGVRRLMDEFEISSEPSQGTIVRVKRSEERRVGKEGRGRWWRGAEGGGRRGRHRCGWES